MRRYPILWLAIPIVVIAGALVVASMAKPSRIVRITQPDAQLQAASKEAQAELPLFIQRLQNPKPRDRFAILGKFKTPVGAEYLWVKDPKFEHQTFTGTLDQQPIALKVRRGQTVSVAKDDIFDWMVQTPDGTVGGYTDRLLRSRQQ